MDSDAQIDPSQVQWNGPAAAAPPVSGSASAAPDASQVQWDDVVAPAPGNQSDFSHGVVGAVDAATTSALNAPHAIGEAGKDLYRRVKSQITGQPIDTSPSWIDKIPTTTPTPEETNLESRIAANPYVKGTTNAIKSTIGDVMDPAEAGDIATLVTAGLPVAGRFLRGETAIAPIEEDVAATAEKPTAEAVLAQAAKKGDAGAAAAVPSLEGASQGTRDAIANAQGVHLDAVQRHLDTDTLPMPEGQTPAPLRKGQATRDDAQISDEINMRTDPDTQGLLAQSIKNQNDTLGLSMGEIRREATPEVVGRTTPEHGQVAVDAIKNFDNGLIQRNRDNYGALAEAAGGVMPLDTGATLSSIKSALDEHLLTETAAQNPVISAVLRNLKEATPAAEDAGPQILDTSGKPFNAGAEETAAPKSRPLTFSRFNNAISNLAEVQRKGGSDAAAAAVVRQNLEAMPLTPEWQHLKDLRDVASAGARQRFNIIEQNPAYSAAINDNVPKNNGMHVVGAPSPLADKFMDNYFTGNGPSAARAYVSRIKGVMGGNPDFTQAVEASSLNKLRDAAGLDPFDTGNFAHSSFKKTLNGMSNKADVLMSPSTVDNVNHLARYSDNVNYTGKASSINRSNTALTLKKFGAQSAPPGVNPATIKGELLNHGANLAAAHAGPLGVVAKNAGSFLWKRAQEAKAAAAKAAYEQSVRDATLKFAQDATAPGAGIDLGAPSTTGAAPLTARATGGRVDHEALTNQLFNRWKAAQKHADKATEPLLNVPDAAIAKALKIAQAAHI